MEVIDEDGFLFGIVNIIDALVVLLVLAVVTAGVALVFSPTANTTQTQTITFRSTPQPSYVVESIGVGPVPTDEIVMIRSKTVTERGDGTAVAILRIRLEITTTSDGLPRFKDERLYVGRTLTLDLGTTIIEGTVIDIGPVST